MIIGFFGSLGEVIGREIDVDTPSEIATVKQLKEWLATKFPDAAPDLTSLRVKAAIDDIVVRDSAPLTGASTVEFFPPLSGG